LDSVQLGSTLVAPVRADGVRSDPEAPAGLDSGLRALPRGARPL